MAANKRTADEAIFVDSKDNQVDASHEDVALQVVAKGGTITPAMEERYPKIFGKAKAADHDVTKSDAHSRSSKKSTK